VVVVVVIEEGGGNKAKEEGNNDNDGWVSVAAMFLSLSMSSSSVPVQAARR